MTDIHIMVRVNTDTFSLLRGVIMEADAHIQQSNITTVLAGITVAN